MLYLRMKLFKTGIRIILLLAIVLSWHQMDECHAELEATHWTYLSDEDIEIFYERAKNPTSPINLDNPTPDDK